ncbi:MAG: ABC transporter permease [bacterium]
MFGYFTIFTIFIASLGLFGLAAFTAEQRTKEIGVRKIVGASVPQLFMLITKDFALLVFIAMLIGTPTAYYGMSKWL